LLANGQELLKLQRPLMAKVKLPANLKFHLRNLT
jgi:hypothetical protein